MFKPSRGKKKKNSNKQYELYYEKYEEFFFPFFFIFIFFFFFFFNQTCDTAITRGGITSSLWLMLLQEVVHGDEPMGSFHCSALAICHSALYRDR